MTTILHALCGLGLGALGAGLHLALLRRRARWVVEGRPLRAWLAFPVGLAVVAGTFFAALAVDRVAAWTVLPGLLLGRAVGLREPRRRAGR
jgi:hypothetical protein